MGRREEKGAGCEAAACAQPSASPKLAIPPPLNTHVHTRAHTQPQTENQAGLFGEGREPCAVCKALQYSCPEPNTINRNPLWALAPLLLCDLGPAPPTLGLSVLIYPEHSLKCPDLEFPLTKEQWATCLLVAFTMGTSVHPFASDMPDLAQPKPLMIINSSPKY